jgi:hypothetical protein
VNGITHLEVAESRWENIDVFKGLLERRAAKPSLLFLILFKGDKQRLSGTITTLTTNPTYIDDEIHTVTLMPLYLISQESMKKLMILVTKVEQSKKVDFLGVRQAFSNPCLVVKTLSWPIPTYIDVKLCCCSFYFKVSCLYLFS